VSIKHINMIIIHWRCWRDRSQNTCWTRLRSRLTTRYIG